MKFNDLLEKNIIRLAPMAGVSNAPFRTICLDNGSGFVTTEEIDSISLVYNKSDRTKLITAFSEYENPIAMQLLGCDSESLTCLLYTSPSPRDQRGSRMPSSA